jgi:integrase
MPKLTEELTDKVIRNLPVPAAGNVLWYDPALKGFAGRVTSKSSRAFIGVYHFEGVERRDTLGGYPEWTAKAAREVFKRWKRDVDLGIDPRGAPAPEDPELFKQLAEQFLAHGRTKRGRPLRPSTIKEYRHTLITYAAGLHNKAITDIRRRDVADLLEKVARERGTTAAMHAKAALSRFFGWLLARDRINASPAAGVEGYTVPKRNRVLSDAELKAIWAATEGRHDFYLILRILLMTGCRRAEAGGMRWSEMQDGLWLVPGQRTKNHRPLVLPLPTHLVTALAGWRRIVGRDLVFGQGPHGFQGWSQRKRRIDVRLGFTRGWAVHDLRRTVETRMAELGVPKEHVNKVLNHAAGPVTEAYDQWSYLPEKAAALQLWADRLGEITRAGPNVVRLKARA